MYISISVAIWIPKSRVDFTRSDAEEWGNHPVLDQNQLLGCPYRNYQMLILWDVNYMADMGGCLKWGYPATHQLSSIFSSDFS